MSLIRLISSTVIAALLCSSCADGRREPAEKLDAIGHIINVKPDSALALIQEINRDDIISKADRASLALLYSIALDKNHLDVRDDSILRPAIEYYLRKGTAEEQVKTLYYSARIYENSNEYEKALSTLTDAESRIDKDCSPGILVLLYSAKGRIYQQILDYSKAAENYHSAARYSNLDSDIERYVSNTLREAHCLIMCSQTEKAAGLISGIGFHKESLSSRNLNKYHQLVISIDEKLHPERLHSDVETYLENIKDPSLTDWLLAARIYIKTGDGDKAFDCLNKYDREKNATYHYLMAQAYESGNDLSNALKEYKKFIPLYGRMGKDILVQDTKFVEEREMHQEMYEKEKSRRMILSLAVIAILLGLALAFVCIANIRKQLKIESLRKENLQRQIDDLMQEREELAAIENSNREGREIINERLRIIDRFVMSDAFNDSIFEAEASGELRKIISDRGEFVRQNRLIFNQSSPNFISHLKERGLSDIEIDHCCLYAIGMNGKMVTAFTNIKRHYHIGSDVRKKLGLGGHDTNISIYIRNLYREINAL